MRKVEDFVFFFFGFLWRAPAPIHQPVNSSNTHRHNFPPFTASRYSHCLFACWLFSLIAVPRALPLFLSLWHPGVAKHEFMNWRSGGTDRKPVFKKMPGWESDRYSDTTWKIGPFGLIFHTKVSAADHLSWRHGCPSHCHRVDVSRRCFLKRQTCLIHTGCKREISTGCTSTRWILIHSDLHIFSPLIHADIHDWLTYLEGLFTADLMTSILTEQLILFITTATSSPSPPPPCFFFPSWESV